MKKLSLFLVVIGLIILFILYFYTFHIQGFHHGKFNGYDDGALWDIGYGNAAISNICKFEKPKDFQLLRYMQGHTGPSKIALQVYGRNDNKEYLILFRMPLHLHVDPSQVEIKKKALGHMKFTAGQQVWNTIIKPERKYWHFVVKYFMPFFWTYEDNPDNHSLILRGLDLQAYDEFETDIINGYIWYGDFQDIDFDKKKDGFAKYLIISLYFDTKQKIGAVALVKDKKTGSTFFVIRANDPSISVDKEEFESFLKTINFEAEIYDPDELSRKAGIKFKKFIQSD